METGSEVAIREIETYLSTHPMAREVVDRLKLAPEDFGGCFAHIPHVLLSGGVTYEDVRIVLELVRRYAKVEGKV